MSNLASATPSTGRTPWIALGLGAASVATWLAAASGADELWLGAAFLGLVAAAVGWRARREARRSGGGSTIALVAGIVGALVAAQVIAFTIAWGVYHLAT